MSQQSADTRKHHWHLAVWSNPQIGTFVPVSVFAMSKKRSITIPELTAAKSQRNVPDGAVLVNVAYIGCMPQHELTGISPDPVPTTQTPAFTLGLEQTLSVLDVAYLMNAYQDEDSFNHGEWEKGRDYGLTLRMMLPPSPAAV